MADSSPKHHDTPPTPQGLPALYTIMAIYGIGFGLCGIVIGLFVGPYILLGAIGHVVLGVGFAACAIGISEGRRSACTGGILLSGLVAAVAFAAVIAAIHAGDFTSLIVWGCLLAFFAAVTAATYRARHVVTNCSSQSRGRPH